MNLHQYKHLGIASTVCGLTMLLFALGGCMKKDEGAPGTTGLQYRANNNLVSITGKDVSSQVNSTINKKDSTISLSTSDLKGADGVLYKLNVNIKPYTGVNSYNSGKGLLVQMTTTNNSQPFNTSKNNYVLDSPYVSNVKIQSEDGGYVNGNFTIRLKNVDTTGGSNKYMNLEAGTFFLKYQQ